MTWNELAHCILDNTISSSDALREVDRLREGSAVPCPRPRNIDPTFFLVWNPRAPTTPRYRHTSHASARREAERLAALHPDQRFYVLAESGYAVSESVKWHCDQSQWDEQIPF